MKYPVTVRWHKLVLLGGIAFLLCVVQLYFLSNQPGGTKPPKAIGDGPDYENIAFNLYEGRGFGFDWESERWRAPYRLHNQDREYELQFARRGSYVPTTARPPLLPWTIATIYWAFGRGEHSFFLVRAINAIFIALAGALAVGWCWSILRRAEVHWLAATVGAAVVLLLSVSDRTIRGYATDFLTEPMAMLLTQGFAVATWSFLGDRQFHSSENRRLGLFDPRVWVLSILLALMVLCRSIFIFFLPGMAFIMLLLLRCSSSTHVRCSTESFVGISPWRSVVWILFLSMLMMAPWWLRNCWILGSFKPLGTQGTISLLGGYSDESWMAEGEWQLAPELRLRARVEQSELYRAESDPVQRELIVHREASQEVWNWIQENRVKLPQLALMRVKTLWGPYSGRSMVLKSLMILGVIWLCWFGRGERLILLGLPLATTLVVMGLYSTGGRFLVPCYGIFYQLAGLGVGGWLGWLFSKWGGSPRETNGSGEFGVSQSES